MKELKDLIDSNIRNMDANMTKSMNTIRKETDSHGHTESMLKARLTKVSKLIKPLKVPTWINKMSRET